ncbi:hypothetical protein [Streptomyces xanthophaeus]|uniref:hypothetical protein n=1 Tax=Streptomyces xanthophaeus TaxID=67385 RepID=UPI0026496EA7|nr:hypothetical protein [Streptomyces xanthophaeus]WKD36548.1 hypothetical protein KO717_34515 [Streptomyces xanthophaeus]
MARPGSAGADSRCPRCRAPVLTQWVGQIAALNITADLQPLTPSEQAAVREPNRLIWCLRQPSEFTSPRLAWTGSLHPATCPHPHVTEHRCTTEPDTLF